MKKLIAIAVAAAMAAFTGCDEEPRGSYYSSDGKSGAQTRYLCVGMENSARFGRCPGCASDVVAMRSLLRDKFGYAGYTLVSESATKHNVVSILKEGIEKTSENGMFLFCYSGHGGQEALGGKEPDGSDRKDEYLCLYDTYLLDDEIWDIVSKCKGRVFLYFDACHSATMYRSVSSEIMQSREGTAFALSLNDFVKSTGFTFSPSKMTSASALSVDETKSGSFRMLCWSGCKEAEYSYGGAYGGVMTRALSRGWKTGISYGELWDYVNVEVQREQPTQHPSQTRMGVGFEYSVEAFR